MSVLMLVLEVIAGLIVVFGLFYRFWFLRDPLRLAPSGSNIVSPADGKVIEIRKVNCRNSRNGSTAIRKSNGMIYSDVSDVAKDCWIITIFMTPLNVHYQRAPYEGKIISTKHTRGTFKSAEKPRPENENNQILIKTSVGNMKVIQIAGFIARRIVCFVKKNEKIKKGQKLGIIKLGSQVCLIMPASNKINLKIKKGDKVKAGETIIAAIAGKK